MSIFGNSIFGNRATGAVQNPAVQNPAVQNPAVQDPAETAGQGDSADTAERSTESPQVHKSDAEWREELTPEEFYVLRQAGTERPFTGEYWDTHTAGVYQCRACGTELFTSNEKFDSHCGWPSFWAPLAEGTVRYIHDRTLGMDRIEVRCAACDSHLGHVFEGEGYPTPTDQRYCINSVSLRLVPREEPQVSGGNEPG